MGLLIGDALGVPYEFHDPKNLSEKASLELTPPKDFARAHNGTPPGTWSDDGAQALCLLASLLHWNRLEPQDLGNHFMNWYGHGHMAVDARVFDVGIQTSNAIQNIRMAGSYHFY